MNVQKVVWRVASRLSPVPHRLYSGLGLRNALCSNHISCRTGITPAQPHKACFWSSSKEDKEKEGTLDKILKATQEELKQREITLETFTKKQKSKSGTFTVSIYVLLAGLLVALFILLGIFITIIISF